MGRRRVRGRDVNGILLLDKPSGITSNDALQQVKRLYFAKKAGHTGSLDPLASGVLPVCMGEATKVSAFLLDADKRYEVRCQLGVKTTTADAEGEVVSTRPVENYSDAQIESVLEQFRGAIEQIPPMYSALKHEGQRLYKLARQGVEVERDPRPVDIHELTLTGRGDDWLDISVHCSKGTYVRTLVEDIGERLGCGAHVSALRRTAVGPYGDENLVTLEQLEAVKEEDKRATDDLLLPIETALTQWPNVNLSADAAFYLRQGQAVLVPRAPTSGWVRLYEGEHTFLGMGEILDDGRVAPRRMMKGA
ncbi:tRNA pseudouridine synthase B [Thiogranum longum]|uniref:tRNA pseudouridine synthase B n=2 Tax=root TaxID=1 RepID=A0A4R1HDA3_9GAMM|nr:tRNA pseudouridine(55) synthase TruB [Thiogranum longum]TCK18593.1 tRNA pseudouridine synthase B [Thiogranum longum]